MKEITRMLELRKSMKAKQPTFLAQDSHKKACIRKRWAKPRGLHSKMRLSKKGYRKRVRVGYGGPTLVKGLHISGLMPVLVSNTNQLSAIDRNKECALISGTVGMRKRLEILSKIGELKIKVINVKDVNAEISKIKESFDNRKKQKGVAKKQKDEKRQEIEKAAKKKEDEKKSGDELAEKLTQEEKKLEEKKEQDKVLTQKGEE